MKPLDLTKPLQTRDGRPARVICTDRNGVETSIVALVMVDGNEIPYCYTSNGCCGTAPHPLDLINAPVKHVREYWVNCYENGKELFWDTRERANERADTFYADSKRIACKKIVFEFEEGEGL